MNRLPVVLIVSILLISLLPAAPCLANLVTNSEFEAVQADGTPEGWQFFSEGTGTGKAEMGRNDYARWARIVRDTGGDYTGVRQRLNDHAVDPSKDYIIFGSYSASVDGIAHPCVYYLNENGQFLGAYEFTLPKTEQFGIFMRKFRPHPGTKRFEIQLRAQGKPGEVRYHACDMGPMSVDPVPAFTQQYPSNDGTRYAVLGPGTSLSITLADDSTGLEVCFDHKSLQIAEEVLGQGFSIAVNGKQEKDLSSTWRQWVSVFKPDSQDGRKTEVVITAPDSASMFLVGIRPIGDKRLKPLSVEFGGWEAGNFAPKAQWIGDSEKLIAEDTDLAMAEMMQGLTEGGKKPFIVLDSLTKPIKGDVVRQYVLGNEKPAFEAQISAAKGESEAFQVVLLPTADGKPASISGVRCGTLRAKGASIPSSAVQVYRVGYVDTPWGDRIPDPLFTDLKMGDPKDPLVLMADVRVPRDAKPGEYTGDLRMVVNGRATQVPIKLTVRPFSLPEQNHLRTCFWFFRAQIKRHYSLDHDPTWEEYRPYLDMSLRYRLTPVDCNEGNVEPLFQVYREADGTFSIDWTEFDRFAEYILARGANVLHLAPTQWFAYWFSDKLKGAYSPETFTDRATGKVERFAYPYLSDEHKKMLQWYLREACDHFEKKGWLKYAYLQPFDEVGENPEVVGILRTCEEADPRVKILMDVLRPGDSKPMTEMIDIWCPLSPNLPGGGFDQVRKEGDEVWWYVCIGPRKPYANLFTNWSMPEHRQLFWQSWKYQAQGLLYWGNNFWNWWGTEKPYDPKTAWPAGKWSSSTTSQDTVGDGYFIYPGPNGPLPSLRLQAMLDGIEDYEYLWVLKEILRQYNLRGVPLSMFPEAQRLLAVPESFCKSLTEYSRDPKDVASLREQVAKEIERLTKGR